MIKTATNAAARRAIAPKKLRPPLFVGDGGKTPTVIADGGGRVTLPFPPSANRYWRSARGRVYVSEEAKAYKASIRNHYGLRKLTPTARPIKLTIDYYRPRKSGDLDNRIKILGDALQGVIFVNDAQIVDIHARQFDDKTNPRVELFWEEIE